MSIMRAFRFGVKRVVSTSSIAILGWSYSEHDFGPDYLPVDEDHPVKPQDVYGLSKEIGEDIARSYSRKGLETVVLSSERRGNARCTGANQERRGQAANPSFKPTATLTYVIWPAAYRLAVERPIPSGSVMFVATYDSIIAEPLCDLLPRLMPDARALKHAH